MDNLETQKLNGAEPSVSTWRRVHIYCSTMLLKCCLLLTRSLSAGGAVCCGAVTKLFHSSAMLTLLSEELAVTQLHWRPLPPSPPPLPPPCASTCPPVSVGNALRSASSSVRLYLRIFLLRSSAGIKVGTLSLYWGCSRVATQ